jgi:hypothetical protein
LKRKVPIESKLYGEVSDSFSLSISDMISLSRKKQTLIPVLMFVPRSLTEKQKINYRLVKRPIKTSSVLPDS